MGGCAVVVEALVSVSRGKAVTCGRGMFVMCNGAAGCVIEVPVGWHALTDRAVEAKPMAALVRPKHLREQ